jgi:hypothetical protein
MLSCRIFQPKATQGILYIIKVYDLAIRNHTFSACKSKGSSEDGIFGMTSFIIRVFTAWSKGT